MTHRLAAFAEQTTLLQLNECNVIPMTAPVAELPPLAQVYEALVLAVRDYVTKNGFNGAVLGLSGGIDSALTLAIAVDALGKDKVQALMMPFRYTADISIADAKEEAEILGVKFDVMSIEPMFDAFMGQLAPMFADTGRDTTERTFRLVAVAWF